LRWFNFILVGKKTSIRRDCDLYRGASGAPPFVGKKTSIKRDCDQNDGLRRGKRVGKKTSIRRDCDR